MDTHNQSIQQYDISILCLNCRKRRTVLIPFGIRAKDYMDENKCACDSCGCRFCTG